MIAFLSPLFLAGALAAAVPILLHLLKREPETRLQFSAVKLLRGAPVEHSRKQYLRDLLLLALRVTALLLLALAFARPFFRSDAYGAASGITVVAIDTSLSMSAGRQFERAKQLAREAVDRAPAARPGRHRHIRRPGDGRASAGGRSDAGEVGHRAPRRPGSARRAIARRSPPPPT